MGKTPHVILCLLLAGSLGGVARTQDSSSPKPAKTLAPAEEEVYAVYSAFIRGEYKDYKLIVIGDTAGGYPTAWGQDAIKERMASVEQETLDDFFAKKESLRALSPKFELGTKYVLVGGQDLKDVFRKKAEGWDEMSQDWERFYAKYPASAGILSFSLVGYNRAKNQALIYAGKMCGPLCGLGQYVLLEKKNGAWAVKEFMHLWAS